MPDHPIAEQLAKGQREISISEFFTRNRHLLGFDNPARALLMTVKEGVDNSLTYDMPLLVRVRGRISIVKIGEFIDNAIKKVRDKVDTLQNGDLEKIAIDDIEALAFDKETLKLDFRNVSALYRHKVNSKIYRVKLTSGRHIDLTAYHSIFTLSKGKVVSIPTSDLQVGMPIIVPRKSWGSKVERKELNLIEELLLLPSDLTSKINIYGINTILSDNLINELKKIIPESKHYRIQDFKRCNYLPLSILRQLNVDINNLNDSKIGMSLCKYKLPAVIKLDHNFAELLGLYVAEGSTLKSMRRAHFSFGFHEKDLIYYTSDLFEKVFKFSPKLKRAHKTAINLISDSSMICFFLKNILNVGNAASSKRIPDIIYSLNKNLRESFLLGYLAGDGYPTDKLFQLLKNGFALKDLQFEKVTCATSSYDLFIDLQYILSSLGIGYSIGFSKGEKRYIKSIERIANFKDSYFIYIYSKNHNSAVNYLPIDQTIVSTKNSKLNRSINRYNQLAIHIDNIERDLLTQQITLYEDAQLLLSGDLGILNISSIKEIEYEHDWVYDISVPNCENFIGGAGAILCHNSLDATAEMRNVLPEVKVQIEQISETRFKVIIEDNGPGIVKEQIPNIFAKLLYGSKFHTLKQSMGQQGIGISAAVLYSQLTTGKPTKITSKISPRKPAHYYELNIDTKKNEPVIAKELEVEWEKDHGTKIEIELEAKYLKGKQSVDEYVKQTAIANPHATLIYINPEKGKAEYLRGTNQLPIESKAIKPHPHGIELGTLIKMLHDTSSTTLKSFLQNDFSRIGSGTAKLICQQANLYEKARPAKIAQQEAEALFKALQAAKVIAPSTDCLSPITADILEKGLRKEIQADFYTTITRPPTVYRGFPFQIEVGILFGGELEKESQIRLMRFANRVPLLYQQGACAITEAVTDTNWKPYGLQQSGNNLPSGPAIIIVHIASVWVPFTSEAKEAIAHYDEIIKEIKLALQECGRKLATYIRHNVKAAEQKERIGLFEKYIPELASSLSILSDEKKTVVEDNLKKILKKSMSSLLEENGVGNDKEKK